MPGSAGMTGLCIGPEAMTTKRATKRPRLVSTCQRAAAGSQRASIISWPKRIASDTPKACAVSAA